MPLSALSGLSSAEHICLKLTKPSRPFAGMTWHPDAAGAADVLHTAGVPPTDPQVGHALAPCLAITFSATRICSSRDAEAGEPTPPLAAQVACLNCRPPAKPLPVLAAQLPPDSHCATASQFMLSACAVPVDDAVDIAAAPMPKAPTMTANLTTFLVLRNT